MYVIDTNILITPYRQYYTPSLAPGFWTWLERKFATGEFVLLDRVAAEITQGNDPLSEWTKRIPTTQIDSETLESLNVVNTRVVSMGFNSSAINEYSRNRVADQFVIAHAHAHNLQVITEESFQPNIKRRVPIPNVCTQLGIKHYSMFPWLHNQGLYLVEGKQRELPL